MKESQHQNVLVLANLYQDFKMVKQVLIEQQWMFYQLLNSWSPSLGPLANTLPK